MMPNNKKSKCQQLFIVGCLSLFIIILQTTHVVLCDEEIVDVISTIVSETSSSPSPTTTTTSAPIHISSTLNNVPSSTIGSMITASVVPVEVTQKDKDDNGVKVDDNKENVSSSADKLTTNALERSTTSEPIPSALPLVQHTTHLPVATNESDINNVVSTTTSIDTINSNEIHENEITDDSSRDSGRVKNDFPLNNNNNNINNQKNIKKPINIDDFYPSKMEDFKMVIQQSNEKLLREKEMLRNDDDEETTDEITNPLLKPMDLLPIISDKKDLLLEDRNSNGSDIATTNIEIELIEPDATKAETNDSEERDAVDITEKLQENDEVIKRIEENFKIDDMDLRPDIVFDVIPSKSSTVPTTIETKVMSTTTTTVAPPTTTHKPNREYVASHSHHIPQESGFIPRRVKKNDPKIEAKISVVNRATLKRIDFANTKFKSHPNTNGVTHGVNEQQQNLNKYKSTGASSAEFSTTKFYNSKETDINKSNDSGNNNNTVVQTTVTMAPSSSEKATNTIIMTTNSININNDNNKKSTTIASNVQTDDDTTIVSTDTVKDGDSTNNKNSNNKSVVDVSITANVYPADVSVGKTDTVIQTTTKMESASVSTVDTETLRPTIKIPVFHPLVRPRILSRLQEKINQLDCDLQNFPPQPPQNAASGLPATSDEYIKIWRGNETHELSLPIVKLEDCSPSGLDCSPTTISWESTADIQSGDLLLVEIDDSQLVSTQNNNDNQDGKSNSNNNLHHTPAASVYQVTRPGHEHCDITEGELLDITPLVVDGKKLVTLYDKDLTEGVNFLIVVSELWGQQCVRLKVTVKSDNCGENADCSGKGVCYSNKSMEGYECQCCSGFSGSHCEEIDACTPSPCTNNGICVDLSQGHEGNSYQCLCPYGYTGKNCQFETDPCNPSQCMNGGSCVGNSTHFRCDCVPGFTGPLCQHNLNECESSPCVHGICVDQEDGFRCFCQPGFAGELCNYEYNECESNPCLNGGQCIDHISGFSCKCTAGYTGKRCHVKVDFCANDPCPDGHRCIDHGDDFSCECPGGRNGPDCNQVPRTLCNVNPCANGGTCWTTEESFYCACRPGFTGKMCEDTFVIEQVVNTNELLSDLTPNAHIGLENPDFNEDPFEVHSVYVAIGTLTAAICIVAVVVTACHCKVHQTYKHFSPHHLIPVFMRRSGSGNISAGTDRHWLSGKGVQNDPENSYCTNNLHYHGGSTFASDRISRPLPPINLDSEMYYTVDFSDSQNSPLIQ